MVFYDDVSELLFENSFILKDGMYIDLMNLLYENYKNRFDFSLARYVLKNKENIDYIVLKKLFFFLEKEFNELTDEYIQNQNQNQIEENENQIEENENQIEEQNENYFDLKMLFTLIPIPIAIFCGFVYIL